MNIYDTYYMLPALEFIPKEHNFFQRRYFPTNTTLDVFNTSTILVDFKENTQKRAPFVLPRLGPLPVTRDGFRTATMEPANIAISIPLTYEQLVNRGFGESMMSGKTPADRARAYLMRDLETLRAMVSRTRECMTIETILNNGSVMAHLTDDSVNAGSVDVGVHFYEGTNNPTLFTPTAKWTQSVYNNGTWTPGNWYNDMCSMIHMLTTQGKPVTEFLVSQDIADFLMTDGWIISMLDNRRAEMGRINPDELETYVYTIGSFNFHGRQMPILVSNGTYTSKDASGNDVDVPYMPDGTVIAITPNVGRGMFGAVTLMDSSGNWQNVAAVEVPQRTFTQKPPASEISLTSRPLFVPNIPNPWVVAKNVLTD